MDEDERRRVAHLLEQAELIERVARVLGEAMEGITPEGWDRQPASLKDDLLDGAAAVLIHLMTAEGWTGPARSTQGDLLGKEAAMTQYWNVLDRLPDNGHAQIWRNGEQVLVDIRVDNATPLELRRIAQHLLEAAGYSTLDVVEVLQQLDTPPT